MVGFSGFGRAGLWTVSDAVRSCRSSLPRPRSKDEVVSFSLLRNVNSDWLCRYHVDGRGCSWRGRGECSFLCRLLHARFIRRKFTKLLPSTSVKIYEVWTWRSDGYQRPAGSYSADSSATGTPVQFQVTTTLQMGALNCKNFGNTAAQFTCN